MPVGNERSELIDRIRTFWLDMDMGFSVTDRDLRRASEDHIRAFQSLGQKIIAAQEEEQARIARELHDDLGQQLAAMGLQLSVLDKQLESVPAARESISKLKTQLLDVANRVRNISHHLHPAVLDYVGLPAGLRVLCAELSATSGISIDCSAEPDPMDLPPQAALCLYRVCQESLRNIAKHSKATSAKVRVVARGSRAELSVSDNGAGFDVTSARTGGSIGLRSMVERVKLLQGSASISSAPGRGTLVWASVSLAESP